MGQREQATQKAEAVTLVILLIEDDPSDYRLICELLQRKLSADVIVLPASSCDEAISVLTLSAVDCVIMDHKLANAVSGLECLRTIRQCHYRGALIMVSGFPDFKLAVEAMRAGADDFVYKGTMYDELTSSVERAIADLTRR